ncbi:MAG: hypothetical protein SFU86_00035 [Pirellulaceae bacterium]|nr:hypothetical protein [Pirellulaceae bacterium]
MRDIIDTALEVYQTVNPPNTNPPATTQLPAEPKAPATNWLASLTASPALLIAAVAGVALIVWLAVRR